MANTCEPETRRVGFTAFRQWRFQHQPPEWQESHPLQRCGPISGGGLTGVAAENLPSLA